MHINLHVLYVIWVNNNMVTYMLSDILSVRSPYFLPSRMTFPSLTLIKAPLTHFFPFQSLVTFYSLSSGSVLTSFTFYF